MLGWIVAAFLLGLLFWSRVGVMSLRRRLVEAILRDGDEHSGRDLGISAGVGSNVYVLLSQLEDQGLVVRRIDEASGRHYFRALPSGKDEG